MKTECGNCHRSSKETDGWWTVSELLRTYSLCPRCYRNKSLVAYRETLLEAVLRTEISHSDPLVKLGMEIMHGWCANIIRDTKFND